MQGQWAEGLSHATLRAHRLALAAAGAVRPRRRRAKTPSARPRVAILVMSAHSLSGIVRSSFNVAGYLADDYDVEIVSVVRRNPRKRSFKRPRGVRMSVADNQVRRPPKRRAVAALQRRLRKAPGRLVHPADRRARDTTLWTDVKLLRKLRRLDADVVISTRWSLSILAARAARRGTRVIGQEHINLAMRSGPQRDAIRDGYGAVDAVAVLTEEDRRAYEALVGDRTRVVRIPNAVPHLGGAPSDVSRKVILAAGRVTRQKGFDRLVAAFAEVAPQEPEWKLRICGSGRGMKGLRRAVERRGLKGRVQLPGRVENMRKEMRQASIYALSSRFEGFPMVLLEAMSKGLPAVAFDCPTGPAELLADGRSGVLVPDGDIDAFAQALLELIRDEPRRRVLGAAAVERVEEFSAARVGALWDDLLKDLLAT
jgi:glycosyltransferase involved in cell wall biosynthesis